MSTGRERLRHWLFAWLLGAGVCLVLLGHVPPLRAQQATDTSVKAAYLYNFLPYVDWPPAALPGPQLPLVVGVVGAEAVRSELQAIVATRQVRGRHIAVRVVGEDDALEGLHAVFVGSDANQPRLLDRLRGRPILVITDGAGPEAGSMLNFVPVRGRIRFEASPAAAERAGLKLGSRLLAVAERVMPP
jgi:hypothetical protein